MGKISDAFERYQKEKSMKVETIPTATARDLKMQKAEPAARGPIIHSAMSPKLVTLSAPESMEAENFKLLKAQVLFPKQGEVPKTILVTSAFPGEGKTYVSTNFAVSLAQGIDEHVLLVDCDLRKPTVHQMFGFPNSDGLYEYLTGQRGLSDLIFRTRVQKLSLITAGRSSSNPADLLGSVTMKSFLDEVKQRYLDRFIIVDAPPSQVTAETNVLANYVDAIIFVVMALKTPRETIQRSIENLGRNKVIGIVFNGYSQSRKPYYNHYKRYYGKST